MQVSRLREKLAVLAFWHAYADESSQAGVRAKKTSALLEVAACIWACTNRTSLSVVASVLCSCATSLVVPTTMELNVQNLLACLDSAISEVHDSTPLHKLLHLVRYAGNRLNMQGAIDCDIKHSADAIRAVMARYAVSLKLNEKLLQVLDTKTFHAGGSKLIHFIVAMCALLSVACQCCLPPDQSSLPAAVFMWPPGGHSAVGRITIHCVSLSTGRHLKRRSVCRCERSKPELLQVAATLPSVRRACKHTFEHVQAPLESLKAGVEALEDELAQQPPVATPCSAQTSRFGGAADVSPGVSPSQAAFQATPAAVASGGVSVNATSGTVLTSHVASGAALVQNRAAEHTTAQPSSPAAEVPPPALCVHNSHGDLVGYRQGRGTAEQSIAAASRPARQADSARSIHAHALSSPAELHVDAAPMAERRCSDALHPPHLSKPIVAQGTDKCGGTAARLLQGTAAHSSGEAVAAAADTVEPETQAAGNALPVTSTAAGIRRLSLANCSPSVVCMDYAASASCSPHKSAVDDAHGHLQPLWWERSAADAGKASAALDTTPAALVACDAAPSSGVPSEAAVCRAPDWRHQQADGEPQSTQGKEQNGKDGLQPCWHSKAEQLAAIQPAGCFVDIFGTPVDMRPAPVTGTSTASASGSQSPDDACSAAHSGANMRPSSSTASQPAAVCSPPFTPGNDRLGSVEAELSASALVTAAPCTSERDQAMPAGALQAAAQVGTADCSNGASSVSLSPFCADNSAAADSALCVTDKLQQAGSSMRRPEQPASAAECASAHSPMPVLQPSASAAQPVQCSAQNGTALGERAVSAQLSACLSATPEELTGAASILDLPMTAFLDRAKVEVTALEARYERVLADFEKLLKYFAQPVPTDSALRGQEPEQFLGHVWKFVERFESAAKERAKVQECLVARDDEGL